MIPGSVYGTFKTHLRMIEIEPNNLEKWTYFLKNVLKTLKKHDFDNIFVLFWLEFLLKSWCWLKCQSTLHLRVVFCHLNRFKPEKLWKMPWWMIQKCFCRACKEKNCSYCEVSTIFCIEVLRYVDWNSKQCQILSQPCDVTWPFFPFPQAEL